MAPISSDPKLSPQGLREAADSAQLRAAARAPYEGHVPVDLPAAVKRREERRAERERAAYKRHYLGTPRPR